MPLRLGQGAAGSAALRRQPVFSPDIRHQPLPMYDELWEEAGITLKEVVRQRGYRAILSVPLISKETVLGALCVYWDEVHRYSEEEVRLLEALAQQAAIAIENARLYRESQRALGELQVKNAELDSFVYSVSHDLKAPLVAMQGMAGAILEDCGDQLDEHGRHYLGRLQANVQQMERLIQDLLALSRIGREARAPETVSVAEVVDDFIAEHGTQIRERRIKVSVRDVGTLWGIRMQIEQVLANLIGNAIKYTGDGPSPTVEVGMIDRGALVECFVTDNGIGIDPAYHQKVFEIFQRLNEVEAEGTGVGLALVKKIVEAAGGRVWVESAKGQGATFRFTWPAAPEEVRA
jgi:signal transduction histidine kinase